MATATWIRIVALLTVAVGALAAAAGLFWTPPGEMSPAPNLHGKGLYRRDTLFTAAGAQGADLVTLILIRFLWALARGSSSGHRAASKDDDVCSAPMKNS